MPELPEVETIRRTLARCLPGKKIEDVEVRLPKLVRPDVATFVENARGRVFGEPQRKGKVLILPLGESSLLVHFRLTGQLVFLSPESSEPAYTHLVFALNGARLAYADLRQFGWLEIVRNEDLAEHPSLVSLGPEPFDLEAEEFYVMLTSRRRRLKALLLDQQFLAGLGNIYVDESLFRARLHPEREAATLSFEEARRLLRVVQDVLREAIATGGSSVRNYVDGEGREGRFQERHLVYQHRERPCPRCKTPIVYKQVAGRGTYFCPRCQR